MKNLKLSKVAWLILSAGIFVVVLAGLGLTYSGQVKEQKNLDEELSLIKIRLDKPQDTVAQQQQLEQLRERLEDSQDQLAETKDRLRQAILSVDVTERFFQIAESCDVVIMSLGTTEIQTASVAGVTCLRTTLHGTVRGELSNLVDFVVSVNEDFVTGYIVSAQIAVTEESAEDNTATVQMEVYSYKGS